MYRMQILLEPEQRRRLELIASREGRNLSDVARRALDIGLDALSADAEETWQRRVRILDELRGLRAQQPFEYSGDLVNGTRGARQDVERVWRQGSRWHEHHTQSFLRLPYSG
jgi:hypothetical protein